MRWGKEQSLDDLARSVAGGGGGLPPSNLDFAWEAWYQELEDLVKVLFG